MVSVALHEPYVHAGQIKNLSGPHVARGPQVPHPCLNTKRQVEKL